MKQYIKANPWKIIEDRFDPALHQITESLMSIGNGRMGQRANLPEKYSGESLQGSYIAGVYYPDKTRVGWWKNGYPEYFAKVLNSVNWIGVGLKVDGEEVDFHSVKYLSYHRELDMKNGVLRRDILIAPSAELEIRIISERFYSIVDQDLTFQSYKISMVKGIAEIEITPGLDFNVRNSDSNYDEDFWYNRKEGYDSDIAYVQAVTRKTEFTVAAAMKCKVLLNKTIQKDEANVYRGAVRESYHSKMSEGDSLELEKHLAICSSMYHDPDACIVDAIDAVNESFEKGYAHALQNQSDAWQKRWAQNDIAIQGDIRAQQGIRFNIFHLYQTYSGEDPRLNIGPKGFTGEKYGGTTYWDTEAYCLPFYMSTTSQEVARNLLVYRHRHLAKAIENAELLGFDRGAALYPMVTMNGEECHNEWEITFEEIHRNGAIAYAIFNYIRYTGDAGYLVEYGLDVLIGIARFWAQRVNWSPDKKAYVMLGVTGPNEYENNVNNNWYTNYIARWCLSYTLEMLDQLRQADGQAYAKIVAENSLDPREDIEKWQDIVKHMYLPKSEELGIFLQQDGFLDKEDLTVDDLSPEDRPINQNWSWDRILRSPFIKQADVLQGMYFFEEDFDLETHRRNFLYYEPKTVHESSLSPCIHSILAARLGMKEKAYEMYLRTARLDLDDYNNDSEDGCHITSMAGTWMTIVEGFAGMQVKEDRLRFVPFLPEQWGGFAFRIDYRGNQLEVQVDKDQATYSNQGKETIILEIKDSLIELQPETSRSFPL